MKIFIVFLSAVCVFSFSILAYAKESKFSISELSDNSDNSVTDENNTSNLEKEELSYDIVTEQNIDELETMGIILNEANSEFSIQDNDFSIQTNDLVSESLALEEAKQEFPQWEVDSDEVTIEYHKITNDTFRDFSEEALEKNPQLKKTGYMSELPVYIVSYKGMSYEGNVPDSYEGEVPVHHEYNVVIDASTGEPLMAFSYR